MLSFSSTELQRRQRELAAYVRGREALRVVPPPGLMLHDVFGVHPDDWQRRFFRDAMSSTAIAIVASRQTGKSTVEAVFIAHCMMRYPGFVVLACSRSLRQAALLLAKIKQVLFHYVPRDYAIHANTLGITLRNGSQAIAVPCQGADAARGFSPDLLALDEAAFVPDDVVVALTPSLAATRGALHMISSPNGRTGAFFEACEGVSREDFTTYRVRASELGRFDPEWLARQKTLLGPLPYRQEFEAEFITMEGAFFNAEVTKIVLDGEEFDEAHMTPNDYIDLFEAQMADMAMSMDGAMRRQGWYHA